MVVVGLVRRVGGPGRGVDLRRAAEPEAGAAVDAFDDLVGLARLFPHPNLRIDVLAVAIDEIRSPAAMAGLHVARPVLGRLVGSTSLRRADDLWRPDPGDLGAVTSRPRPRPTAGASPVLRAARGLLPPEVGRG